MGRQRQSDGMNPANACALSLCGTATSLSLPPLSHGSCGSPWPCQLRPDLQLWPHSQFVPSRSLFWPSLFPHGIYVHSYGCSEHLFKHRLPQENYPDGSFPGPSLAETPVLISLELCNSAFFLYPPFILNRIIKSSEGGPNCNQFC